MRRHKVPIHYFIPGSALTFSTIYPFHHSLLAISGPPLRTHPVLYQLGRTNPVQYTALAVQCIVIGPVCGIVFVGLLPQ